MRYALGLVFIALLFFCFILFWPEDENNTDSLEKQNVSSEMPQDKISASDSIDKSDENRHEAMNSEYKILEQLNFNKYNVGIFTIEHNFMEQKRKKINNLLTKRNYIRVFERISKWDDWYIEQDNKILKEFFIN